MKQIYGAVTGYEDLVSEDLIVLHLQQHSSEDFKELRIEAIATIDKMSPHHPIPMIAKLTVQLSKLERLAMAPLTAESFGAKNFYT